MKINFAAHCVRGNFFGRGEPGCFHSCNWLFKFGSYERAQMLSIATILKKKSSPSLWYRFNKPVELHSGASVAPSIFHGVLNAQKAYGNPECRAEWGAQFCDIFRLSLLDHAQFIGDQHPTEKQGVELCCSPSGVVLYGDCPKRHPCLPGTL